MGLIWSGITGPLFNFSCIITPWLLDLPTAVQYTGSYCPFLDCFHHMAILFVHGQNMRYLKLDSRTISFEGKLQHISGHSKLHRSLIKTILYVFNQKLLLRILVF